MGRTIHGHPGLDRFLDERDMGHAGGVDRLGDLPGIVAGLSPLWWEYTEAEYGFIEYKGGFMGNAHFGLVRGEQPFTAACVAGIKALHECMARDPSRRRSYGDDHADRLTLSYSFQDRAYPRTENVTFADGADGHVTEGTRISALVLSGGPSWVHGGHAGSAGLAPANDGESRISSVMYPERAIAVAAGWKRGLGETPTPTDPGE